MLTDTKGRLPNAAQRTRASTGCGSCSGLCQSLLRAVVPEFAEEVKKTAIRQGLA